MASGTPGTISNLTPALAHAVASAAAPFSSGSPPNSRTASCPSCAACTSVLAVVAASAGSVSRASRAQVAPGDAGQVRGRDDQAGLAEQFGRAYRQQPLVAGTGADQGDPSRRRLLDRC